MKKMQKKNKELFLRAEYKGIIPPPNLMEKYENIKPGFAERIMKMAEQQSSHRREMEKKYIKSAFNDSKTGLWLGFIIVFFALCVSGFLIYSDKVIGGTILGTTSLASLAGVFVYGTRIKNK